jgi:hypothetical protein
MVSKRCGFAVCYCWQASASSPLRLRDPGLIYVTTKRLMDPLRKEPRFQAIERTLKFPA